MDIEQIIARQEEKLDKICTGKSGNMTWAIENKQIKDWHSSSIKEILEGVVEREKRDMIITPDQKEDFTEEEMDAYNQAKSDTITHLESLIKKLK